MLYPLDFLLSVRHMRENNAKRDLAIAEMKKQEAEQYVKECEKKLNEYKIWLVTEEEKLFSQIIGHTCTLHDVNDVKQKIVCLRAHELVLQEAIENAKNVVLEKEQEVANAREKLRETQKEALKIATHKDIWTEDSKKEMLRLEDIELEEFTPKTVNDFD